MSLILKGSPSGTVYAQYVNSDLTSSTAQAVYVRFIPSPICASPYIFLADKDAEGSNRGFSLTQNSPTSVTVGWITSAGANEHTFTVASGTAYDVMSVYDRTAGTIKHYVDSATASQTFTSVGTPIAAGTFCLRIKSSPRATEDIVIGDLAVWNNGKPSTGALNAMQNKAFLGNLFRDSGCTDRYSLQGGKLPIATMSFYSVSRLNSKLILEKESISTDPQSTTGDYLPKPNDELKTQVSSARPTYWDMHRMCINQARPTNVTWKFDANVNKTLEDLVTAGYYDKALGRFTSMPPRYEGMQAWQYVIDFPIRNTADRDPVGTAGTFVLEWTGTGEMGISGSSTSTRINSNRIEFTGGFSAHIKDIPVGGYIENIRLYRKINEAALNDGRIFIPEAVEYWGRYDTIRMMDASNINVVHNSEWDQVVGMNDFWNDQMPIEAQIQLAMETDNNLWFNFPAMLGADISDPPLNQWGLPAWEAIGIANAPYIEGNPKVTEFFTKFVAMLNQKAYPLNRDLRMEMGNELWNSANPFQSAFAYCHGISVWLASVAPQTNAYFSGVGFLSAMFMTEFQKALDAGGRATQIWTPIIGAQTAYTDVINQMLKGAKHYVDTRPTTFKMADYVVSTTGYMHATMRYDGTKGAWLGATYNTKAEYYAALTDMATNDNIKLQRLILNNQFSVCNIVHYNHVAAIKVVMASYGVIKPIEEYEGSSHNTLPEEEWNTITVLRDTLGAYNISDSAAAAQRLMIEGFGSYNPGGAISNFQVVGGSATNIQYSAWFEAYNWNDLPSSKTGAVWADYIDAPVDPAVTWSAYKAILDATVSFETINIDATTIRSNNISLPTSSANVSRVLGSIFHNSNFDTIDFEDGEFFYTPTVGLATYTPVLQDGDFTGFFDMAGVSISSATMYYYETNADEWYRFVVNTNGSKINFTANSVVNAALNASVYLTGTIYGLNALPLSGTGVEFSNNGSTWSPTINLISGVTTYRKQVVASGVNDTIVSTTISITDGTDVFTNSADVITEPGTQIAFANETEAFNIAENATGIVATISASGTKAVTYNLTGPDAARFTVAAGGVISLVAPLNFEAPTDAGENNVYNFTLNGEFGIENVSVDITATVTNVIEHAFTFAGIVDQVNVVPESTVTVTSALLGGTAGVTFEVTGMESSTNGGTTYSSDAKAYVVGSTFIRMTATAASAYNDVDTIEGTVSLAGGADSVPVSFDITTKAPLVSIDLGPDVRVTTIAQTNGVTYDPTPVAGDGTITYAITGGADEALFVINTNTGTVTWITPPIWSAAGGTANDYVIEITATNTDGYSTTNSTVVVTVEVKASSLAYDLEDLTLSLTPMTDGTWSTNQSALMTIVGTPASTGIATVKGYHDVIKFVRLPRTRTVTIDSINSVVGGTASSVLGGKYIVARSTDTTPMTMNVTVSDSTGDTITFAYTITF